MLQWEDPEIHAGAEFPSLLLLCVFPVGAKFPLAWGISEETHSELDGNPVCHHYKLCSILAQWPSQEACNFLLLPFLFSVGRFLFFKNSVRWGPLFPFTQPLSHWVEITS